MPGCRSVSSATKLQLLMSVRNIDLAPISFIKVGRVETWAEVGLSSVLSYIHNLKGGIVWKELSSGGEGCRKLSTTSEGTTTRHRGRERESERDTRTFLFLQSR